LASEPRRSVFAVRALREVWRLAVDRAYRHQKWLRLLRPKGAFQPFNTTRPDRYPRIFRFVQEQLGAGSKIRILSYGCSTGEEVFSLRRYFPYASIKGIDINPGNIAVCRRRLKQTSDRAITFEVGDSTRAESATVYDAIFCMAVLRHGSLGDPGVRRCDHLIRFEDFAKAVGDFERCLKPGGLLVIRNSNFRLCDSPAAAAFETLLSVPFGARAQRTPIFGPDNCLMEGAEYPDTVFRKLARLGPSRKHQALGYDGAESALLIWARP
jgi:2-polyprenyl-3-methyl-5-hydroxy-6-metoxy-1,4-benzoquinol methylase